jgi:hypothetical protein
MADKQSKPIDQGEQRIGDLLQALQNDGQLAPGVGVVGQWVAYIEVHAMDGTGKWWAAMSSEQDAEDQMALLHKAHEKSIATVHRLGHHALDAELREREEGGD